MNSIPFLRDVGAEILPVRQATYSPPAFPTATQYDDFASRVSLIV
jgi:hypothetical protein